MHVHIYNIHSLYVYIQTQLSGFILSEWLASAAGRRGQASSISTWCGSCTWPIGKDTPVDHEEEDTCTWRIGKEILILRERLVPLTPCVSLCVVCVLCVCAVCVVCVLCVLCFVFLEEESHLA
jgi:hypothetical protein